MDIETVTNFFMWCTIINGGILNAYGTNARHGHGEWIVVEADESEARAEK